VNSIWSRAERTRRNRSTRRAFEAAQCTWSIALAISTTASTSGLPLSRRISAASSGIRCARTARNRSRRARRPAKPSPAQNCCASRARATVAATASAEATGNRPTSSPVAGLVETSSSASTNGVPGVRVAVMA
jgi:hypothetical protein